MNEVEVKHAVKVHLFNLYTDEVGNPAPPGAVKKRKKQAVKPWVIAAALAIVIVPIAVVVFLKTRASTPASRPSKPESEYRTLLQRKADSWADTVFAAQGADGGIKMSPSSADATTQAWQTAQCLVAVLSLNKNLDANVPKIKNAFKYLEELRRPSPGDGWNLYGNSSPYTITEIGDWVTLANIKSLDAKTAIWNEQEKQDVIKRVVRDLDETIRRQDSGGGWRPIRDENTEFTRTYPTVMALWSLIEAKTSPSVGNSVGKKYDEHIRKGIDWLLRTYSRGQGGFPTRIGPANGNTSKV